MLIDRAEFALECVSQAEHFGVHPHYLLAVAQLRSSIADGRAGDRVGPFRFTLSEWNMHRVSAGPEVRPAEIESWRVQCRVFAVMTSQTQQRLLEQLGRYPNPTELYRAQWSDNLVEVHQLAHALRLALNSTASLIETASDSRHDESTAAWAKITEPEDRPPVPFIPIRCDANFAVTAPSVMSRLMRDFGFTEFQAASIVGNLGHRFGGTKLMRETRPSSGTSGDGWAHWREPRRGDFEAFCRNKNLHPTSDEANYAFLKQELQTSEHQTVPALKATTTLNEAVRVFDALYVRAGGIELDSRRHCAERALKAFRMEPHLDTGDYVVWYGTNRQLVNPADIQQGYSATPDRETHYGWCRVFVPASHRVGSLGTPWWQRVWWTDDRPKLLDTTEKTETEFWKAISSHLHRIDVSERHAVIFVHGYNVSFQDAALRAAQIGYDLSIKGAMAFFSWPSQGKVWRYAADETTIEASEDVIAKFMVDFAQKSQAKAVHIIAHSMGNRGVSRAVDRIAALAKQQTGVQFSQIILAAADVHADTFRQFCAAYLQVAKRTTLYVSARDRVGEASRWLHKFPRVGLLPPVFVFPGIDTVNVTNVDLSKLGHSYVSAARCVLEDINELIRYGSPPDKRVRLQSEINQGEQFWSFRK